MIINKIYRVALITEGDYTESKDFNRKADLVGYLKAGGEAKSIKWYKVV